MGEDNRSITDYIDKKVTEYIDKKIDSALKRQQDELMSSVIRQVMTELSLEKNHDAKIRRKHAPNPFKYKPADDVDTWAVEEIRNNLHHESRQLNFHESILIRTWLDQAVTLLERANLILGGESSANVIFDALPTEIQAGIVDEF